MDLCEIANIKYIQKKFGFRNSKSLGQNFLTNKQVIQDMVDAAEVGEGDLVIEVGPGIGVLTTGIAERAGKVIAVELDKALLPVLDFTLAGYPNVEVINRDILKVDLPKLIEEGLKDLPNGKVKIMGNLPYYITTPIITELLEKDLPVESITIMMQKEVADRVVASPGSKIYGALSVLVQFHCLPEEVVFVPKENFFPEPKVDSAVIKLTKLEKPSVEVKDKELFFRLVRAGFGQRRKTLLNALGGGGFDKEKTKTCLELAGIDGGRRAETLSLEEFARLADCYSS